ncbi:MAG: hypothetical protein ABJC04_08305 [Verrucomicrobiota bacterium]
MVHQQKKELTAIRFHLEAPYDPTTRADRVTVLRASPIELNVIKDSFLDERDVSSATLVDYLGGFVIQIQFDAHGTFVLDSVTSSSKGKRIVIKTEADDQRWIAAPMISHRIGDGTLIFTPDATRLEAERIVRGLNNTSAKLHKKPLLAPW